MKDTGFSVSPAQLDRLAAAYGENPQTGALALFDGIKDSKWSRAPAFPDGAGGLVSTVDDYFAFGQMMLNKGKYGNKRILSRLSVEAITTDQLTPAQKAMPEFFPGDGRGWGFGVSMVLLRDDIAAVPGRYGWDGGFGTSWASDPAEDMVGILMTQSLWTFAGPPKVHLDFWTSAYQAIDD
jgi:CubicO group peptidase (beta-lactamase class C family)